MIPFARSSSRISSALAKFFAFLASWRSAIRSSISLSRISSFFRATSPSTSHSYTSSSRSPAAKAEPPRVSGNAGAAGARADPSARQAPFGESGLIVSAEAEMLRLFLYSKIHAKYRKPIDMVGNIMYDDVVRFEQTRSKEVAQDAEPELSERTVRQSNATLPDKAVWSGASFCVPLSRSISSLTSTICPGVCEEQAPVIFWSNPQFLETYRHKST